VVPDALVDYAERCRVGKGDGLCLYYENICNFKSRNRSAFEKSAVIVKQTLRVE
jgi:hypothetical protein